MSCAWSAPSAICPPVIELFIRSVAVTELSASAVVPTDPGASLPGVTDPLASLASVIELLRVRRELADRATREVARLAASDP